MRLFLALLALFPAGALARPFEGLSRRDQVALLFRPNFQFTPEGEPLVSIGLVTGLREATLRGAQGLDLLPAGEDGVELPIPAGVPVRIRVHSGRPARVRFWAAVRIAGADAGRAARELDSWRGKGFEARLFQAGGVLGLGGEILDNRVTIVALEAHPTRERAAQAVARLAARLRAKLDVYEELAELPGGVLEVVGRNGSVRARVHDLLWITSRDVIEIEGRTYRGTVYVTFDSTGRLAVANVLPIEQALLGVVPAEIYPRAPLEALKAQAVSARGEVIAKIGTRHFGEPFRVCNAQHCQVYKGHAAEHPRASQAVRVTRGQVLWGDRTLVDTVYSASCGGHTEHNDVVWGTAHDPYLRGRVDGGRAAGDLSAEANLRRFLAQRSSSHCARARLGRHERFRWTKRFTQAEIAALVAREKDLGPILAIEAAGRGVSGRVTGVRVRGERGELVVEREYPVRRLFGGLWSGMFVVDPEAAPEGSSPGAFVFRGGGWGHGVGMCQTGAVGMAEAGRTYRRILEHYYAGARVRSLY